MGNWGETSPQSRRDAGSISFGPALDLPFIAGSSANWMATRMEACEYHKHMRCDCEKRIVARRERKQLGAERVCLGIVFIQQMHTWMQMFARLRRKCCLLWVFALRKEAALRRSASNCDSSLPRRECPYNWTDDVFIAHRQPEPNAWARSCVAHLLK